MDQSAFLSIVLGRRRAPEARSPPRGRPRKRVPRRDLLRGAAPAPAQVVNPFWGMKVADPKTAPTTVPRARPTTSAPRRTRSSSIGTPGPASRRAEADDQGHRCSPARSAPPSRPKAHEALKVVAICTASDTGAPELIASRGFSRPSGALFLWGSAQSEAHESAYNQLERRTIRP